MCTPAVHRAIAEIAQLLREALRAKSKDLVRDVLEEVADQVEEVISDIEDEWSRDETMATENDMDCKEDVPEEPEEKKDVMDCSQR